MPLHCDNARTGGSEKRETSDQAQQQLLQLLSMKWQRHFIARLTKSEWNTLMTMPQFI